MSKSVWNSGTEKTQELSFRKIWHSIKVASSNWYTDYFLMIAIGAWCKQCDMAITTATPPQWQMVLLRAMLKKHGGQAEFQRDEYCSWLISHGCTSQEAHSSCTYRCSHSNGFHSWLPQHKSSQCNLNSMCTSTQRALWSLEIHLPLLISKLFNQHTDSFVKESPLGSSIHSQFPGKLTSKPQILFLKFEMNFMWINWTLRCHFC